tara:strand:+ start:55 stop:849 length:795 start_codon:yes stop_codon:yes gene_type:complete
MIEDNMNEFFVDDDPPPFTITNKVGKANLLLVCDHASPRIPVTLENLGLENSILKLHIAYDIGALAVAKNLSSKINCPLVSSSFSRLVIDLNRPLDHPDLILKASDRINIPGNLNLTKKERSKRINFLFKPYHAAINQMCLEKMAQGDPPSLISIHSFNPSFGGKPRPWDIGVLWKNDSRLSSPLIRKLRNLGFNVGDNKPYSGHDLAYTVNTHGTRNGLASCALEINQEKICTSKGINAWSEVLGAVISDVIFVEKDKTSCCG